MTTIAQNLTPEPATNAGPDCAQSTGWASVVRRLDAAYWEACKRADLVLDVSVGTPEEWAAWSKALKRELRGYWHGETGCIADRLPIPDDEWEAACDLHCPGWRTNKVIGDASLNPYRRVMTRAGLLLPNVPVTNFGAGKPESKTS